MGSPLMLSQSLIETIFQVLFTIDNEIDFAGYCKHSVNVIMSAILKVQLTLSYSFNFK